MTEIGRDIPDPMRGLETPQGGSLGSTPVEHRGIAGEGSGKKYGPQDLPGRSTSDRSHEDTKVLNVATKETKAWIERSEQTPVSREVIDHLQIVRQRGPVLMDDPRHGAIHGTGLETIQLMAQSGFICGQKSNNSEVRNLSVYPTVQLTDKANKLSIHEPSIIEQLMWSPEDSLDSAKIYAGMVAKKQAFLTKLELPLSDTDARMHAENLIFARLYPEEKKYYDFDEAQAYFLGKAISPEAIDIAFEESLKRKGFLLGISPKIGSPKLIIEGIMLFPGDKGSSDIRISSGSKGLPHTFLSGIEPLGSIEEAFLKNLSD